MKRILADKEARRRENARKPWHEKVATIERLREAGRLARESMRKHQQRMANLQKYENESVR
jgi:hypothetical protein